MSCTRIVHAVRELPLEALELIVQQLLSASGFDDIRHQGRSTSGQKTRHGGFEFECRTTIGAVPARVVVKVLREDIRLRGADEMLGVRQRRGAHLGLIITTKSATQKLESLKARFQAGGVEWWDGNDIANAMVKYQIGARSNGEPDYAYLMGLEEGAFKIQRIRKELDI